MSLRSTTALASSALAAALLAVSAPVFAQSATELPPVPVDLAPAEEGLIKPLAGSVLTQDDLAAKVPVTSDTARLLQNIPGVNVTTGGGASSLPTMRGLADDRLKILVDGMPITAACPNHMNPALSYIDPTNVGRIEVLPGITPVSAGGDSIGGTITVDSPDPAFAAEGQDLLTTGKLSTTYRSNNRAIALSGDVTAATKSVSVGYAGSFTQAGDYHRGGDGAPVETSKFQIEDHALTLAARHDTDLIVLQGGWQFSPYEGFPNQYMDMTENLSKFVNGRYAGQFGWGTLDANAYWRGVKHEMNFLDRIKGNDMPMYTDSDEVGYGVKAEIPLNSRDTVRIGNEFQRYTLDDWWPPVAGSMMMGPNNFQNIGNGERNRVGTYAEWEAQWTPQWSTLLGARNDTVWMDTGDVSGYNAMTYGADAAAFNAQDHAKTDVNFDLTALTRFEPDKASAFEAGYARKTRSPSLYERYTWSTGAMATMMNNWFGDGNGYVGDVDLKPEVAHTVSISGDWHDPARKLWGIKVSPYYTYVQDYIDADDIGAVGMGSPFRKLRFANHDAQLYGLDVSGNLEAWDSAAYGRGVLKASVGWVKGKNLDTGDNLYNIMPLNARLAVEHQLSGWSNAVELHVVDGKDTVSASRVENRTPAYALVNLRTGYEWSNFAANFAVENVFDQMYHQPLGGNDAVSGEQYNVYGMGRSFIAGMTVKF